MVVPFYIFIAIISTIFYAIGAVYSKLIMSFINNPITLMIYQFIINLFVVFFTFIVYIFLGTDFSNIYNLEDVVILIISSIFIFGGVVSFYYGMNRGNVSVATVVISSRVLVVIPIGILFLSEIYPGAVYFWILLVLFGVLFVTWEKGISISDVLKFKGTYYYIITNILWAIANSLITYLHNNVNYVGIILIRLIILTFLILILSTPMNKSFEYPPINRKFNLKLSIMIFFLVLTLFLGDMGYIYSLGESITLTEAIGSLQGLFTFFIVLILSKAKIVKNGLNEAMDKKTLSVRITGAILAVIGTLGIVFAI